MGSECSIVSNMSHRIVITTCVVIMGLVSKSSSATCSPTSCGNGPNISHPFWIPQQQEPSCGYQGFEITCNGKNPVLSINDNEFFVKDIFYTNLSVLLASPEVYDENINCPVPSRNFSILNGSPFNYSSSYVDLYFYYNCTSLYNETKYSVDCASNGTGLHSFAVFHPEIVVGKNFSVQSCQKIVNAPANADSLIKLLQANYTDVLRKGFVLQWECSNCKKTGS